jgi:hypothetical protein
MLREKHRLKVSEKWGLRRIFGSKTDEVTGGWRKLHNEELHSLQSSSKIVTMFRSRRMRLAGHVVSMGNMGYAKKIMVRKPGGKILLGRPRHR